MEQLSKEELQMPQIKSEDTALWWRILRGGTVACGLDENLVKYRRAGKSLSSQLLRYPQIVRIQISQVTSLCLIHSQVPRPGSSQIRGMGQQPDPPVSGPPDIFFDELSAAVRPQSSINSSSQFV